MIYGKVIHTELEKVEEAHAAQIFYIVLPGVVILSHYYFIVISIQVDRHHQSSGQLSGQLTPVGQMAGIGAFGNPQLEASVLVHNVTRIAAGTLYA